jgi:hypothetical protein
VQLFENGDPVSAWRHPTKDAADFAAASLRRDYLRDGSTEPG